MRSFVLTLLSAAVTVLAAPIPLPDPVCYVTSTKLQYAIADLMRSRVFPAPPQPIHCWLVLRSALPAMRTHTIVTSSLTGLPSLATATLGQSLLSVCRRR